MKDAAVFWVWADGHLDEGRWSWKEGGRFKNYLADKMKDLEDQMTVWEGFEWV